MESSEPGLESTSPAEQGMTAMMNRLRCDAGGQKESSLSSYQIAAQTVTLLQTVVEEAK